MADWADLILRTGVEHGYWPDDREHRHERERGCAPASAT